MCNINNAFVPLLTEYELFYWSIRHVDGTHVNAPPEGVNTEEVEKVTDMFASSLTIGDPPDIPPSTSSADGMEGDNVHITNEPDTTNSKDSREDVHRKSLVGASDWEHVRNVIPLFNCLCQI